jgi:phosphoketolase
MASFDLNDDSVVVIVGSGAAAGPSATSWRSAAPGW